MKDFQDLANEAFADLLKKYHRPVTLKDALKQNVRGVPANDQGESAIIHFHQLIRQ